MQSMVPYLPRSRPRTSARDPRRRAEVLQHERQQARGEDDERDHGRDLDRGEQRIAHHAVAQAAVVPGDAEREHRAERRRLRRRHQPAEDRAHHHDDHHQPRQHVLDGARCARARSPARSAARAPGLSLTITTTLSEQQQHQHHARDHGGGEEARHRHVLPRAVDDEDQARRHEHAERAAHRDRAERELGRRSAASPSRGTRSC